MSWKYYNPNPRSNLVGDCVIRALSLALNQDWDETYLGVKAKGYELKDMTSSNTITRYAIRCVCCTAAV